MDEGEKIFYLVTGVIVCSVLIGTIITVQEHITEGKAKTSLEKMGYLKADIETFIHVTGFEAIEIVESPAARKQLDKYVKGDGIIRRHD